MEKEEKRLIHTSTICFYCKKQHPTENDNKNCCIGGIRRR